MYRRMPVSVRRWFLGAAAVVSALSSGCGAGVDSGAAGSASEAGPDLVGWDVMVDVERVALARIAANSASGGIRFDRLERFACSDQNRVVAIGRSDALQGEVVLIPRGVVHGARALDQNGRVEERPCRLQSSIWVARTELTVAQWDRLSGRSSTGVDGRLPVTSVDWIDATRVASAAGGRLLRPSEWEYVARGGARSLWCDGDAPRSAHGYGWFAPDGGHDASRTLRPVGAKPPNAFGVFDMHGNAGELVYAGVGVYSGRSDPEENEGDAFRLAMGGSVADTPRYGTCSSFEVLLSGIGSPWNGVRICFDARFPR